MNEYNSTYDKSEIKTKPISNMAGVAMFKVYLWFALGLLITGVVSLVTPNLLLLLANNGVSVESLSNIYLAMIVVSVILMLPSIIIIHVQGFRKNRVVMLLGYIIYALSMGVLLSALFLSFVDSGDGLGTICLAFFLTGGVFFVMGAIGALTKKNLNMLWPILLSLMLGVMVISLVNMFINADIVYWITDFVMLGVMLIVIAIDTNNIKRLAESGSFDNNTNLAIYFAFNLYYDFIWLFVRIFIYIISAKNR